MVSSAHLQDIVPPLEFTPSYRPPSEGSEKVVNERAVWSLLQWIKVGIEKKKIKAALERNGVSPARWSPAPGERKEGEPLSCSRRAKISAEPIQSHPAFCFPLWELGALKGRDILALPFY